MTRDEFAAILGFTHPLLLLAGGLLYALGAAMVRYLGGQVPVAGYLAGQAIVTCLQLTAHTLDVFYAHGGDRLRRDRCLTYGTPEPRPTRIKLRWLLFAGVASLTVAATLAALLLAKAGLGLAAAVILLSMALAAVFYGTPPVRLAETGYGELTAAFFMGAAIPSFAFAWFYGDLHRLLLLTTPPLVSVLLAVMIALSLPHFGRQGQTGRRDLASRIGWRTAMRIHDVAVLFAFLLLVVGIGLGLPRRVGYGALLALPLGLAEIWYLRRIRAGGRPNWPILIGSAHALVGLMIYLMLVGFLLS